MNGEQIIQMKDTRTETGNTVPDTFRRLSPPHFDELAVAVAQPVQPLPSRAMKLLRSSLFLIAYLIFIVAVVGVAYFSPPSSRADVSSESMSGETQSDSQPALDDSSSGMTGGESIATPEVPRGKAHSSRASRLRFQNQTIEIVEGSEGKPAPRKVGEIRYGRSSDRP